MESRARLAFFFLILAQALHSVEEYRFRLFDALAPARAVSEALGFDRSKGFIVTNAALVGFGLWCYLARVRPGRGAARGLAWFWALLEIANGIAHGLLAVAARGYFPGLATAPLLVAIGAYLAWQLGRSRGTSASAA